MTSTDLTPLQVYHQVSQAGSFASRADRGTMPLVRELVDGVVQKSDRRDEIPLVAREFILTEHLRGTGVVPLIDVDEGLYGYPLSFQMEKINNGGTLQDWLEFHSRTPIPREVWAEIFQGVSHGIRAVWAAGVLQGDLHVRNVVIGIDQSGLRLKPHIIDFGVAVMDEEPFEALAHGLGLPDVLAESQRWFERQIRPRYNDPSDEKAFLISDIQEWINTLNIQDLDGLLADFRRELRT
ncbi:hypothetical protein NZK33_04705 [Cyanobium sp. FGCU-6]|nr:hypothetical protein [Cyanobium sp. FGCU6]